MASGSERRVTAAGRAPGRVGRRGAFLLFLALLDGLFGYSLLADPRTATQGFDLFLPPAWWAAAWLVTAGMCVIGAVAPRDRLAFGAAAATMAGWGAVQTDLWVVQHLPRGWVAAVIWFAFAATVLIISGWPEPVTVEHPPEPAVERD